MSHPDAGFLKKYLRPLVGAEILKIEVKVDGYDGQAYPVLTVKTPSGEEFDLEIGADEEGNGPGFIFGLPFPE